MQMPIYGPRLTFRKPKVSDLPRLFEIYSDSRTQVFAPAGPLATLTQAESLLGQWLNHWDQQGYGWWSIANKAEPERVIGFGGIAYDDYLGEPRLDIGYCFAVEAWGKGYATELGEVALRCAFGTPGINRVWAVVRPDHAASIRVLEKIGMQRCGARQCTWSARQPGF
ncbi:GNAT family N-acetyltransferase [Pseudomonas japonica]|uniref:GNAT family N-acetyltransferase n=1 Tax=Pseudomonas japonica TaxID=256466 RepID=UPI00280B13C1|nr:GNAT family N-acetyltransferase [Pseudomonas japonica]